MSVNVTWGSDPTHPAIPCDYGRACCRMPSHPIWTQLLALMPFGQDWHCQLRILHPSGHMYLLSAFTVSKTPTDWKKGMPVFTCFAGRVSEGPVPVLFNRESLHWVCQLACVSHINPTPVEAQQHRPPPGSLLGLPPGRTGPPLNPEAPGPRVLMQSSRGRNRLPSEKPG